MGEEREGEGGESERERGGERQACVRGVSWHSNRWICPRSGSSFLPAARLILLPWHTF